MQRHEVSIFCLCIFDSLYFYLDRWQFTVIPSLFKWRLTVDWWETLSRSHPSERDDLTSVDSFERWHVTQRRFDSGLVPSYGTLRYPGMRGYSLQVSGLAIQTPLSSHPLRRYPARYETQWSRDSSFCGPTQRLFPIIPPFVHLEGGWCSSATSSIHKSPRNLGDL